MDSKNAILKKRILQYLESQGIKKSKFFTDVQLSSGLFKQPGIKGALGSDKIARILSQYPDLNGHWLLTGLGPMITRDYSINSVEQVLHDPDAPYYKKTTIKFARAQAGYWQSFDQPDRLIDLPDFNIHSLNVPTGMNVAFEIVGASMHPTISPGSIVLAKLLEDIRDLREGYVHVLADKEDGVVCKRVYRSSDAALRLESDNSDYLPYTRDLVSINALFRVWSFFNKNLGKLVPMIPRE